MTTLREAAQQALEALDGCYDRSGLIQHNGQWVSRRMAAMDALRAALEQPEQEPVAWQERQARRMKDGVVTEWSGWYPCRYRTIDEAKAEVCDHIPYEWTPLYLHPPRRGWQSLTDEEIAAALPHEPGDLDFVCARAIEQALKERNHG